MTEATNAGDSAVEINSTSVVQYLSAKLESISDRLALKSPEVDEDMINELKRFGIESLADLERCMPASLLEHWASSSTRQTYVGMLRDAMMYADIDNYFDKAWLRKWTGWDVDSFEFLSGKYGRTKTDAIMDRYDLKLDVETQ